MENNIFGKKLRELRTEKAISQQRFGEIFNVCNQTVSAWETGVHEPDLDKLVSIARFFDVSVGYLLGEEE